MKADDSDSEITGPSNGSLDFPKLVWERTRKLESDEMIEHESKLQ